MADTIKKTSRKPKDVPFGVADATVVPESVTPVLTAALAADIAAVAPVEIATLAVELPPLPEDNTMTNETTNMAADTATKAAETANKATETATKFFGDMQSRAKDAWRQGQTRMEDVVAFNRGNVEAMVESAKTAVTGWQNIAAYSVDYAKGAIATANENTKKLAAVRSPTEFVQTAQEIARANLDEAVAQTSKFTEGYLKLLGEIVQPIQNRYVVAADRVRNSVSA